MSVVVVGAGIIGASVARQLARRGAKVTVLEAAPEPATGATRASWAWLNANAKPPRQYRDLNLDSLRLWQQQHGDLATFCGCLMLHDERPDPCDAAYSCVHVADVASLEPALRPELVASLQHARLWPQEGWCEPVAATHAFLDDAQAAGAVVLCGRKVESIRLTDGHATAVTCSLAAASSGAGSEQPPQEEFAAEAVVLAAGVGSPALAQQLGAQLPLLHKPAAIVLTQPLQPGLLRHMLVTPGPDGVFVLQRADGRCLIGEVRPSEASNTDTSAANAAHILGLAAAAVPALASASVQGMLVGYRPYPADGYPLLGWLPGAPNVYVAVTHSGLTLAPLVGQLVADEVLAAVSAPSDSKDSSSLSAAAAAAAERLAPYRPTRPLPAGGEAAGGGSGGLRWAEALSAGSSGRS